MSTSPIYLAVIYVALALPVSGQLHLITGSPTPKNPESFGSALLQIDEDANVRRVADLVPPEVGTEWIAVSYEWRKALIWQSYLKDTVIVIDFDTATVVKKCGRPSGAGGSLIEQWLSDLPTGGQTFTWYVAGDEPGQTRVAGMTIDPLVPCDKSFLTLEPADIKYIVAHGRAGVADIAPAEGIHVGIGQDGKVSTFLAGIPVLFRYEIPAAMLNDMDHSFSRLIINNSQVLVLSTVGKTGSPRFLMFRKRDKTWHQIPVRSDAYGCLRTFGKFVAVAESHEKAESADERARAWGLPNSPRTKPSHAEESVGRAEWRKTPSKMGPSILGRFNNSLDVYPGRLHLYDIDSERLYTIVTNQGDSEILLVESDTVYYRVSNRLYSAAITEKGLGRARLLATSEAIRDAHWAFIKH